MFEQFATLHKIHYEVNAVGFLENKVDANNKRVVDLQLYYFFNY
jgi:hypothetical protein